MIKTIVFYVVQDQFSTTLLKAEFVRHEEAIAFANKVKSKESYLVSINQSGRLYGVDNKG